MENNGDILDQIKGNILYMKNSTKKDSFLKSISIHINILRKIFIKDDDLYSV